MAKFLLIDIGGICYDSTTYFLDCIMESLKDSGHEIVRKSYRKENVPSQIRELYGQHFDYIIDINSRLPMEEAGRQNYCLDYIYGEFWHYILDHPFYHHDTLRCELKNYNVICIDEDHAAFVRKYYPHINKIKVMPLAAKSAAPVIPYSKKDIPVLFTGTYTNPDLIKYHADKQDDTMKKIFQAVVDYLMDNPSATQEEALLNCYKGRTGFVPELMQKNFLADIYLTALLREEVLKQLLLNNIPISLYGHDWDTFYDKAVKVIPNAADLITVNPQLKYEMMPAIYTRSKVCINQMPWFKSGMHDRIPLALMNKSVSLSETNPFISERLTDGKNIFLYSIEDIEGIAILCKWILDNPDAASQVALEGFHYAAKNMTWYNWINNFLEDKRDKN